VFNILLQVLDDGRLTDGHGRTVDFRNTVIVMTSNLGSDRIMDLLQDGNNEVSQEQVKAAVMPVVSRHFRPEFINRIDEVVVFHPLQQTQMRGIAEIQLGLLRQRLADLDLQLQLDDGVLDKLAEHGFDPVYGARPLKRAIQQWLENPLAQEVLKGSYPPGSTIVVSLVGQDIAFSKRAKAV
jgi:ATP-dependent Clp protease ATP-binding subunit ClpB